MKNKKAIIIIIAIIFIIFFGIIRHFQISKYGYLLDVEKFSTYGKIIPNINTLALKNNDILNIGNGYVIDSQRMMFYYFQDYFKNSNKKLSSFIKNIEVLDYKTRKVKEINFPEDIFYLDSAILIDDNKLLLTHVVSDNPKEVIKQVKKDSDKYKELAIVDLNSMKIEKTIKRRPIKVDNDAVIKHAKINDEIFILDGKNNIVEIFNIKNFSLKTIDIKCLGLINIDIFANSENQIFITGIEKEKEYQDTFKKGVIAGYDDKEQKFVIIKKPVDYFYRHTVVKMMNDKLIFFSEYSGDEIRLQIFNTKTFEKKEIITKCRNTNNSADFALLKENKIIMVEGYSFDDVPTNLFLIPYTIKNLITRGFHKNIYVLDLETGDSDKIGQISSFNNGTKIVKINDKAFCIYGTKSKLFKLWEEW